MSHQPLLAVASTLLVLLSGCRDNSPMPTGPAPSGAVASEQTIGSVLSSDPLSSRLSRTPGACLVAVRSPDGGYLSRSTAVQLPSQIKSNGAPTARFAYRGWAPGVPEPVLLAVCTIPDAPSARAYFEKRFGGKPMSAAELRSFAQSAGVSGAEEWGTGTTPYVSQELEPTYVTDGLASESNATRAAPTDGVTGMMIVACDPTAIIPEPGCDGYVPEEEYVPDTPPPPDGELNYVPWGPMPLPLPSVVQCQARTDFPHLSTTFGFLGNINVKSSNSCPIPLPMFVSTTLMRQRCFFGHICFWDTITPTSFLTSASAMFLQAMANTYCSWSTGWYRGVGLHEVTIFGSIVTARTVSTAVRIDCFVK